VNSLVLLLGWVIKHKRQTMHENGPTGERRLSRPRPPELRQKVRDAIELTKDNKGLTLCLVFN
jgi:hypothetical protein